MRATETLEAAIEASDWAKPGPWIGRGVAMCHHHIGVGFTNARVHLQTKGTVTLGRLENTTDVEVTRRPRDVFARSPIPTGCSTCQME